MYGPKHAQALLCSALLFMGMALKEKNLPFFLLIAPSPWGLRRAQIQELLLLDQPRHPEGSQAYAASTLPKHSRISDVGRGVCQSTATPCLSTVPLNRSLFGLLPVHHQQHRCSPGGFAAVTSNRSGTQSSGSRRCCCEQALESKLVGGCRPPGTQEGSQRGKQLPQGQQRISLLFR